MSETLAYDAANIGILPLSPEVHHCYGAGVFTLARPAGAKFLVLEAEVGHWRLRRGNIAAGSMPATEFPSATVTNGAGALLVREEAVRGIAATEATYTVKGFAANAVLTYFWR